MNKSIATAILLLPAIAQAETRLPAGYTEVACIVVTNAEQYIDTGFEPGYITDIEARFAVPDFSQDNILYWTRARDLSSFAFITKAGGADTTKTKKVRAYRYSPGESQIETEIPDYLTETEIAYSTKYVDNKTDNTFTVNGQTVDFVAVTWTSVIPNIFLFRLNNAGSLYSGVKAVVGMKLYSFKIIEGDAAKMDFVPCLRNSDSAAGLYDTVGNAFYANAGSGGSFGYEAKKGPGFVIVIK